MPAFVVPFFFVLDPLGAGVLLKPPPGAPLAEVAWLIFLGFFAIAALAAGLQGWLLRRTGWFERVLLIAGGLLVISPVNSLDFVGVGLASIALVMQIARYRVLAT
jgi:TRAP-type uncharacterized transport system fused permease subunit